VGWHPRENVISLNYVTDVIRPPSVWRQVGHSKLHLLDPSHSTVATRKSTAMAARYRGPAGGPPSDAPSLSAPPAKPASTTTAANEPGFSVTDVLRVVGGFLLLFGGLSYLTTNGTSMTWGYNPWWTRLREWKGLWVCIPLTPSSHLPSPLPHSYTCGSSSSIR